jgi:replicative DNA helicase
MDKFEKEVEFDGLQKTDLIPHNLSLEEGVLGALLLERQAFFDVIDAKLEAKHFYVDKHAIIYNAMVELHREDKPIDLITVRSQLEKTNQIENIIPPHTENPVAAGAYALVRLTTEVGSSSNVVYHSKELIELFIRRKAYYFALEIRRASLSAGADIFTNILDKIANFSEEQMSEIENEKFHKGGDVVRGVLENAMINRKNLLENGVEAMNGSPTFSSSLNYLTMGRKTKRLDIIAAYTSHGKSQVLCYEVLMEILAGYKVGIISLEMSKEDVIRRIYSALANHKYGWKIPYFDIENGVLSKEEMDVLIGMEDEVNELMNNVIVIKPDSSSLNDIKRICYRLKKQGVTRVKLDYIQITDFSENEGKVKFQNVTYSLAYFTKSLRTKIAEKLDINIVAFAQLNRETVKVRTVQDLHSSMIADCSALEKDADSVLLFFIPEKFGIMELEDGTPTFDKDTNEYIIGFKLAKQRGGGTAYWNMYGDLRICTYRDDDVTKERIKELVKNRLNKIHSKEERPIQKDNIQDVPF